MRHIKIFQLTAHYIAATDTDAIYEFSKRHEFRLAFMNGRVREKMLDAIVEENGIKGGWFYSDLNDLCPYGPYETAQEARKAAQENAN